MKNAIKMVAIVIIGVMVTGCASWFYDQSQEKETNNRFKDAIKTLETEPEKRVANKPFVSSMPWIVGESVHKKKAFPELESAVVNLKEKDMVLPEIAARLGDLTGINITLDTDLGEEPTREGFESSSESGGRTTTDASGQTSQTDTILSSADGLSSQLSRGSNNRLQGMIVKPLSTPINIEFDTNLKRALNNLASRFSISWHYDRQINQVRLFRTRTRSFRVDFPGIADTSVDVGSSGSRDSVISEEIEFETEGGGWEEISTNLEALLSPWGTIEVMRSSGTVTISDTPERLQRAEDHIKRLNEAYGRQVYIEMEIVSVNMEDGNTFQASWNGIMNRIQNGRFDVGLETGTSVLSGESNTLNVIRTENGAEAALDLLATKATVSQVVSRSTTTSNKQPAPIRVITDQTFISGTNELQNTNSDSGVTTEIETDTIQTGFSATFIPNIKDLKKLQLQVSLELSQLISLETIAETIIQTPEIDRQTVVQRTYLNSGETLVMSGFSDKQEDIQKNGTGSADFFGLGGGRSQRSGESVLLVMVTPYISSKDHME